MESIGFWTRGPSGNADDLSQSNLMKLGGALQGVVQLCCQVAKMEGVEMKQLLNRTYDTCGHRSALPAWIVCNLHRAVCLHHVEAAPCFTQQAFILRAVHVS